MNAIYASKLYRLSSRKNKIDSAIKSPLNVELVKQLDSYIDEPEDVSDALDDQDEVAKVSEGEFLDDTGIRVEDKTDEEKSESRPLNKFHKPGEEPKENTEKESADSDDVNDDIEENSEDEKESDSEVKESKKVQGTTALYIPPIEASCCDKVRIDAEILKGTLNAREDTKGVSRITHKDDELWIYYQDKVNLNTIMEPVIEVMNAANFAHLEFNRLARSSNAIVFDVSCIPDEVEPIEEVKE